MLRLRESSLVTYASSLPEAAAPEGELFGAAAAEEAESAEGCVSGLRSVPELHAAIANNAAARKTLVRIKDCLVTIAGLIESFGLGSPYDAAEDGPVDISLRENGDRKNTSLNSS